MIMELRKNTAVSEPFVIFSKISARHHERFQLKPRLRVLIADLYIMLTKSKKGLKDVRNSVSASCKGQRQRFRVSTKRTRIKKTPGL